MSGKTAFQKVIEAHLLDTLPGGNMVLRLDKVWAHEITTPNAIIDAQGRGCDVVFDPNKVKAMIDHCNPAKDTASAIQGEIMREWSKKHGIEFLDVGRNGICHAMIPQSGWVLPGEVGIMGDSHTCTHGVMCALAVGVGTTELETGLITGLWICPPQKVIRVNFVGELPANVYSKDLILTLISKIGVKGATNAVLEFGGPVIEGLSMDARMTMTNMSIEAGATAGMMMVDAKTIEYLARVLPDGTNGKYLESWNSDPDAKYDQAVEIDVTGMVPVITDNYRPDILPNPGQVVKVSELAGKEINQVYIGSCTNGRIGDLRVAANILDGHKVAENTRCIIVPATPEIYSLAIQEGLIDTFLSAGCFVSGPTCGACLGMSTGVLAPGEVCVSTTNRNFKDRMGTGGTVHLASPATAAITAINGKITEPTVELCKESETPWFWQSGSAIPTNWQKRPVLKLSYSGILAKIGGGTGKDFSGRPLYLPLDNIDTDQIIPARYLTETDKVEMGKHCFEDVPISSEDRVKLRQSEILVAGENFGCGSSREHAPWAFEAVGIRCVIAQSFARIFETNMFANGLLCVTLSKEKIDRLIKYRPETISIDIEKGTVSWEEKEAGNEGYPITSHATDFTLSDYQKELIANGGSVSIMVKLAADLQEAGKI